MEAFAIYNNSTRLIVAAGIIDRTGDQARIDAGDTKTMLGYINARLAADTSLAVWYGPGDPPDPEKNVIDATTGNPRAATAAELAVMPEGLREVKREDAKTKMAYIAGKTHADVDAWLAGIFTQLPANEQDALNLINTNVTDLASAKTVLTKMASALYEQREATKKLAHALLAVIRRMDWDG